MAKLSNRFQERPNLTGWLQDVSEIARELLAAIQDGEVSDNQDHALQYALKAIYLDMDEYRAIYAVSGKPERDPGPSQSARL